MDAASAHLARLGATSRPSGSVAAAEARRYCAEVLRGLGFEVVERPFEFSKFPGAWATSLAGLLVPPFAAGIAFIHVVPRWLGVVLIVAIVFAGALFAYVGRAGVLDLAVMRRTGVNLEARRAGVEPAVWLVAHIDSKWQPISMMMRVLGVVLSFVGLLALAILALLRDGVPGVTTWSVLGITCTGSIPLILSYVGDANHGSLDNASGVAAVLQAAELLSQTSVGHPERSDESPPSRRSAAVGVLITDAEELGLAGARAWARARADSGLPTGIALNCDSVDDDGVLTVMYSSPRPAALLDAVQRAARTTNEPLRVIRLVPGILTDHVALADAGWATMTLSRGTVRTLQRIHTARDTLGTMRGTGISAAARVLAQTATELC